MITGFRTETMQDVDSMWEAAAAAEWERLNAPDEYEKELISASKSLKIAVLGLDSVMDELADAAELLEDCPEADKMLSLYDEIQSMKIHIDAIRERYERGQRS